MTDYYTGEIRLVAFDRAPKNWAFCLGQTLQIMQYPTLFSLLGTMYGGNGTTTFQLPDLRGITPLGFSNELPVGVTGGAESVQLTTAQLPAHTHGMTATSAKGTTASPADARFAAPRVGRAPQPAYGSTPAVPLAGDALGIAGGSTPHNNLQPYLTLNYIIALNGIYPSRG